MSKLPGSWEIMPAFTPPKPWNVTLKEESSLPPEVMNIGGMQIRNCKRGRAFLECGCEDCGSFYKRGDGMPCTPMSSMYLRTTPPPPPYSYMALVNSMRAAAAAREALRDEKRRVLREMAILAVAAALSQKTEKPSKDQLKKKILHQRMKRRRE